MSETKKRVLFVDDEPKVLEGLQRMLRKMRDEWEMDFASGGPEALEMIKQKAYDVVVSDMRMPGMDGAELLNLVMEISPSSVRLILSGHSDKELILKSVGPTHQYLAKPCDSETLKDTVSRAYALRDLLASEQIKEIVAGIDRLPSVPMLYSQLIKLLQDPEASIQDVAGVISSDVGMTAKILQLVNSAFFGLRRHIESAAQAINYLGLDTIQSIVLTTGAFTDLSETPEAKEAAGLLYPHSILTGALAGKIAKAMSDDKKLIDDAVMAGMLHDVGKLVLAAKLPKVWHEATKAAASNNTPIEEAERAICGVSHAEIGAYLLGLWGLPNPIVEGVAFHHGPRRCLGHAFSVLTAVHVANGLSCEAGLHDGQPNPPRVDKAYLEEIGLAEHLAEWQQLAAEAAQEEEANA